MKMEHMITIDEMIAASLLLSTAIATVYLTYTAVALPNERNMRTVYNCVVTTFQLTVFLVLMAIPTFYLYINELPLSAAAAIIMTLAAVICFRVLGRRAKAVLNDNYYRTWS
jgi:hypothetical protein